MESYISATDAARSFSDLINRVHYRGEQFVIERGGRAVCRLVPAGPRRFTLRSMVELLKSAPKPDPGFWDDVEQVQRQQGHEIPRSRWES